MNFPPIRFVVEGYFPEGVSIFAGRPKIGKSWACLDIAIAVASGSHAFGSVPCQQGDVLYLALEDYPRRLQSRMKRILGDDTPWPEVLHFETQFPRLDAGAVTKIQAWISARSNPSLVIIDTLAKIRGSKTDKDSAYEADYRAIGELHALASTSNIAIIIVHHVRKMEAEDPIDTVSGTLGLTGAADTILVLDRKANGVSLYGRGRDIEEIETALSFDKATCTWNILGAAAQVFQSQERQTILRCLTQYAKPMTAKDITTHTGMKNQNVRKTLSRMAEAGEIQKLTRGAYASNEYTPPVTTVTLSQRDESDTDECDFGTDVTANIEVGE